MISTYIDYQLIARDLTKSISRVGQEAVTSRETEYYLENITKVTSIEEFMADDRLYRYAMKAYGLEDMSYAKAFMVKVLEEGVSDSDSFANKLTDTRYKEFATAFNFAEYGATTTVFDRTQQGTVDRYLRQTLEENAGDSSEGVRLALYFQRKAADITSAYDILADEALSEIVYTALGLPDTFAAADIDIQAKVIESRIDIEDFQDAGKLDEFISRFTALWDVENGSTTAATNVSLLFTQPTELGISTDLMLTMQSLKL